MMLVMQQQKRTAIGNTSRENKAIEIYNALIYNASSESHQIAISAYILKY